MPTNQTLPFAAVSDVTPKLDAFTLQARIHQDDDDKWVASCRGHNLSSAFQPIVSLNHRRVVGQEALLRAHSSNGQPVSPLQLLRSTASIDETIELDRLCRLLHGYNYARQPLANEWLFLNITPQVISHGHRYGAFFSQLLQDAAISPSQIVVEVLENRVGDEEQLRESIDYYRDIGCLIAIDDFGAGHSNIDRVLHLEPEIVKLDRSLLLGTTLRARRTLANLVALLHEAGSLVVLEGIETEEQALLAYDVDADMVQGYYFQRPATEPVRTLPPAFFRHLDDARRQHRKSLDDFQQGVISPYRHIFELSVTEYGQGAGFTRASQALLNATGVQRVYLIDDEGFVIGNNLVPSLQDHRRPRPQMSPLQDSSGANLANRHYFRRAMSNPGSTQVSQPYLSTTGAEPCITLSRAVERNGRHAVFCCDLSLSDQV